MTATEVPWHAVHDNLVEFATHLVDDEGYTAQELLDYIEKPWHWEDEYQAWKSEAAC